MPDLWQLHLYGYEADLTVNGTPHLIRPGRISPAPPGTEVRYRYRGRSEHLYVHLRLSTSGTPRSVPVIQDAGPELPLLTAQLRPALDVWPNTAARAAAEVWAALWRVAQLTPPTTRDTQAAHPAVVAAVALIETRLAEPLTVSEIAKTAGVSHNHLTRLFRAATGETVVGSIRARRMERARHFLRATTLTLPAVAASLGIPDLQAFNKVCRRELGAAPRCIRAAQTTTDNAPLGHGDGGGEGEDAGAVGVVVGDGPTGEAVAGEADPLGCGGRAVHRRPA
ncbi:helix-turn-helix transcriptional regulator [Streptomyces dysideae]|uniref:helix-turn-helix transcriptional regulator n=1 Tax=Streptomyces dysideae TaxID=909626 RepID=UPI000830FB43|nr:helix-turn-helix transcriptional regulator [Streptomyces dysideae]